MSARRRLDVAAGLVLAAAAAAAALWVIPEQAVPGDEGEIAPALLPTLAAVAVAVFALVQALATALGRSGEPVDFDGRAVLFAVAATAALAAAVALIAWAGFRVGGVVAIAAIGLAMRPARSVAVWLLVVAAVLPLATYALAWHGLRLALP